MPPTPMTATTSSSARGEQSRPHDDDGDASSLSPLSSSRPLPLPLQEEESACTSQHLPSGVLEGTLLYRRTRSMSSMLQQKTMRMYTVLDMADRSGIDFGSLKCYRFLDLKSKGDARDAYSSTRLRSSSSIIDSGAVGSSGDDGSNDATAAETLVTTTRTRTKKKQLCLDFTADLPWRVRDVENDPTTFIVEIATSALRDDCFDSDRYMYAGSASSGPGGGSGGDDSTLRTVLSESGRAIAQDQGMENIDEDDDVDNEDDDFDDDDDNGVFIVWGDEEQNNNEDAAVPEEQERPNQVLIDLARALSRNRQYVRYTLKCPSKKNEKALWLTAFSKVERLSMESSRKRGFLTSASTALPVPKMRRNSRIRTSAAADLARTSIAMARDMTNNVVENLVGTSSDLDTRGGTPEESTSNPDKEYRVRPNYAYPHQWMTHAELTEEMLAPSTAVHDLRLPAAVAPKKELALLRVDVLQCLGLPRPKGKAAGTTTDPNAVVYLVCGSHAFSTDVISSCQSPMWLSAMKRSCIIPIFHGYARLFAGVFHDDGSKGSSSKDTFFGRAAIEFARLRPGCTYDITLPLRMSTGVYSRRKRGAVRIRLTIDSFNERQIVLSYLPNRRNRLAGEIATTVACADPKAFRNVALTVHGMHLPGKFSTESLMASIREFKFVQRCLQRQFEKFVEDLVVWRNPFVSAFVFVGWMHCVRVSSATLVPVYFLGMIGVQLVRNYARCIVAGEGFQPRTFEEICLSLRNASSDNVNENLHVTPIQIVEGSEKTHSPLGKTAFEALHFIGQEDEYYDNGIDSYALKEFPFSALAGYPRFPVDEALKDAKKNSAADTDSGYIRTVPTSSSSRPFLQDGRIDAEEMKDTMDQSPSRQVGYIEGDHEAYCPRLSFRKPLPEQDIDRKNPKSDKTIAQELHDVEEKVQRFTGRLFDTHTYMITDTSVGPWGRRHQRKDEEGYDVERDLDKLLGLGQYSQWNPLVSKFALMIDPLVRVFQTILSAYRACYNIFTWRDPYLSFWAFNGCLVTILVLLLFPWKIFCFALGVIAVGPQNWIMRLSREVIWSKDSIRTGRFLRAIRELFSSDEDRSTDDRDAKQLSRRAAVDGAPQPVFHCHRNTHAAVVDPKETIGAQMICVPYSPLLYHRFYDWPPDPKYATVANAIPFDPSSICASEPIETITVCELPCTPQRTKSDKIQSATPASASQPIPANSSKVVTTSPQINGAEDSPTESHSQPPQDDSTPVNKSSKRLSRTLNSMGESIRSTTSTGGNKANVTTKKLTYGAMSMSRRITAMSVKMSSALPKSNFGESATDNCEARPSSSSRVAVNKTVAIKDTDLAPVNEVADWLDMPRIVENSNGKESESDLDDTEKPPCIGERTDWSSDWLTLDKAELRKGCEDSATHKPVLGEGQNAGIPTASISEKAENIPLIEDNVESQGDKAKIGGPLASALKKEEANETSTCKQAPDEYRYVIENPHRSGKATNDRVDLTNEEKDSSNDRSSPKAEAAGLQEELMTVKLELAAAHAENDYYQRILKETKLELEIYRSRCGQYEKQNFKMLPRARPFAKKK